MQVNYENDSMAIVEYADAKQLFEDKAFIEYAQTFLPFFMARSNDLHLHNEKLPQECGKTRERALIYLLRRFIGEDAYRVPVDDYALKANERSLDVFLFDKAVSIKTVTWNGTDSRLKVKLSWAEDKELARVFVETFAPAADLLFLPIYWGSESALTYIPQGVQQSVFDDLGPERFFYLNGTGMTKGTPCQAKAMLSMMSHRDTLRLPIKWPSEYRDDNFISQVFDEWYMEAQYEDEEESESETEAVLQ